MRHDMVHVKKLVHNKQNSRTNKIFSYYACARNTPSPTRSDFIMHISCMTQRPCKPLWRGVSAVLRGWGLMQNHAPYACTHGLGQASQKKGCFRAWGKGKNPAAKSALQRG